MNSATVLPETIHIEVKFTTTSAVVFSARELDALRAAAPSVTGLLAALFWCGNRRVDGRWLVVDARENFEPTSRGSQRISQDELARAMAHQPWLVDIKRHLEQFWKPFLQAFFDDAMTGREALHEELARSHADESVDERLSREGVIDTEHRDSMATLIEHHGESSAGYVFQDLFGYLLAHAGYQNVIVNPKGVPDIVVSDLRRVDNAHRLAHIDALSVVEVQRLVQYCRKAGDLELATRLLESIERERW